MIPLAKCPVARMPPTAPPPTSTPPAAPAPPRTPPITPPHPPHPPSPPPPPITPPTPRVEQHPDTALLPPFPSLRYRLPMALTISHRNQTTTGPHAFGGLSLVIGGMVRIDGQGWLGKYQEGLFILCKKILGFVAEMRQASYKSISKTTSPPVTVATPRYPPPMEHEIPNANTNRALRAMAPRPHRPHRGPHAVQSPTAGGCFSRAQKWVPRFCSWNQCTSYDHSTETTSRSDTRTRVNPRRPYWLPSLRQCGGLRAPPNGCGAAWVSLRCLSRYNGRTP